MEMILNENDIVVGAKFENGTVQDYIDENQTYGLIRIDQSTANWFLFNKDDSPEDIKRLYNEVIKDKNTYIKDEFGEEVVLFNKTGEIKFEEFAQAIDKYLDAEMVNF